MLTNKQLLERKKGIGGSESAAVLGCSNFVGNTPVSVYLDKIDPEIVESNFTDDQKEKMLWGNLLEPIVREQHKLRISEHESRTERHIKTFEDAFVNPKYPWLRGNIDGWIVDENWQPSNELVEIKTCGFFDKEKWGEAGTDEIPGQYLLQCAHYCITCDAIKKIDRVHLVAFAGGPKETRVYYYERDKEFEQFLIDRTHDFWYNNVLKRIPPEAETLTDLSLLYPKGIEDKICIATDKQYALAVKLNRLKEAQKNLKTQAADIEIVLKAQMKDNALMTDDREKTVAAWKNQTTKRFQTKILKVENPAVYNQYLKETESRVFRLSKNL